MQTLKQVEFNSVVGKKKWFDLTVNGKVILYAVRWNGDYLYYPVDLQQLAFGKHVLSKMLQQEAATKAAKKAKLSCI